MSGQDTSQKLTRMCEEYPVVTGNSLPEVVVHGRPSQRPVVGQQRSGRWVGPGPCVHAVRLRRPPLAGTVRGSARRLPGTTTMPRCRHHRW